MDRTCVRLLLDCLKLTDENCIMSDQSVVDILTNVKYIASTLEHFPVNSFVDNGKDLEVQEFIAEWKRLFKFEAFTTEARGHLFTSLGGKIGLEARRMCRLPSEYDNFF